MKVQAINKSELNEYIHEFGLLDTPYKLPLLSSILLHTAVLLIVGFAISTIDIEKPQPSIRITLTNSITEDAPEDSDVLAQFNNRGGSGDDDNLLAKTFTEEQTLEQIDETDVTRQPSLSQKELAWQRVPLLLALTPENIQVEKPTPVDDKEQIPSTEHSDSTLAIKDGRLSATLDDHLERLSNGKRHKYINISTKQYDFAAYMAGWVKKVESNGNKKIPDSIKRQLITGDLVLDAAINKDGSVHSVSIWRSSGIESIDMLARQIVLDGAPYAPLDAKIRNKTDVLHIIRTWRFDTRKGLHDISE